MSQEKIYNARVMASRWELEAQPPRVEHTRSVACFSGVGGGEAGSHIEKKTHTQQNSMVDSAQTHDSGKSVNKDI